MVPLVSEKKVETKTRQSRQNQLHLQHSLIDLSLLWKFYNEVNSSLHHKRAKMIRRFCSFLRLRWSKYQIIKEREKKGNLLMKYTTETIEV